MNNTYFIIDDIKYIIAYDNNQLKIKTKVKKVPDYTDKIRELIN